jgi:8-oxo-dGTP diphosphatase
MTSHAEAETIHYTADVVLLSTDGQVLLIKRRWEPYKGQWAFPGGHVDPGETSRVAAARELAEETGIRLEPDQLRQVGAFDAPDRDPRGRYVTVAYAAAVTDRSRFQPNPSDDAVEARWWRLAGLPQLAFDHRAILARVTSDEPYAEEQCRPL